MKNCSTCAYRHPTESICQLSNLPIIPHKDYCSKHTEELPRCDYCRNPVPEDLLFIVPADNQFKNICVQCNELAGTCRACENVSVCNFRADKSMPDMIQKQVRQGNMTTVMTVMNPQKIEKHCKNGCVCFSEDFGCLKQNGTCGNYKGEM